MTAGLFAGVIPIWIENFYAVYFIQVFGVTTAGIAIIFLAPYLAHKWGIIKPLDKTPLQRVESEEEQYTKNKGAENRVNPPPNNTTSQINSRNNNSNNNSI